MTNKRKWLGLMALGAGAVAAAIGVSTRAEAALGWERKAGLTAIETDQNGVISSISFRVLNNIRTVNGCGAKLEALPHLMEHYRLGKAVDLGVQNGCLKGVRTTR